MEGTKVFSEYKLNVDNIPVSITIEKNKDSFVYSYKIKK